MKYNFFAIPVLVLIILISCKKPLLITPKESFEFQNEFNESFNTWVAFKNKNNNSYQYTIDTGSWSGNSSRSVLIVEKGNVIGRSYKSFKINYPDEIKVIEEWVEDKNSLNTHTSGVSTATLDQVYEYAKKNWLAVDTAKNHVYFETNTNGMISLCGYVPIGCADDCFWGIWITEIKPL